MDVMRKVLYLFLGLLLAIAGFVGWSIFKEPAPVEELLSEEAEVDLNFYEESAPQKEGRPSVLVLGTAHLAQQKQEYGSDEIQKVRDSLAEYEPDMVVVEYLSPDYPEGKGRDYRPDLDLDEYSEDWGMSYEEADSLIEQYQNGNEGYRADCKLAMAYFLKRDFVNAAYHRPEEGCQQFQNKEELSDWLERNERHEMSRFGYPIAGNQAIKELVSFDYQGEDAEWFIHQTFNEVLEEWRLGALYNFMPMMPYIGKMERERPTHKTEKGLADALHYFNSPEHIGYQYWVYEEQFPLIDYTKAGKRQTENYWLRNEKMFGYMEQAIKKNEADRVLVIVGAGHKYFLDELVQEADYRWVDPRDWFPDS